MTRVIETEEGLPLRLVEVECEHSTPDHVCLIEVISWDGMVPV